MEIGNESKVWKDDKSIWYTMLYIAYFLNLWCDAIRLAEITFILAEKWECKCSSLITNQLILTLATECR